MCVRSIIIYDPATWNEFHKDKNLTQHSASNRDGSGSDFHETTKRSGLLFGQVKRSFEVRDKTPMFLPEFLNMDVCTFSQE
jgi:hypothetical protein